MKVKIQGSLGEFLCSLCFPKFYVFHRVLPHPHTHTPPWLLSSTKTLLSRPFLGPGSSSVKVGNVSSPSLSTTPAGTHH